MHQHEEKIGFSQGPVIICSFIFLLTLPAMNAAYITGSMSGFFKITLITLASLGFAYGAVKGTIIRLKNKHAYILSDKGIKSWCHGEVPWTDIIDYRKIRSGRFVKYHFKVKDITPYNKRSFLCLMPAIPKTSTIILDGTWLTIEPEKFELLMSDYMLHAAKT